jgi:membrane-bound ClpP family serine protease
MVKNTENTREPEYALGNENLKLIGIGFLIIVFGFILMTGGKSSDPNVFNMKEIFSFRRTTLATLVVLFGFIFEIYAILKIPKSRKSQDR